MHVALQTRLQRVKMSDLFFFKYALFTAVLLPVFLPSVQKLVLLLLVLQLKWLSDRSTYFYIVLFALCIMQLLCAVLLLFCSHECKPCW